MLLRLTALLICPVMFGSTASWLWAATPPNILIVIADDCTFNELPVYGGQNARTPNLDQLASESLVFDQAYLSEAMCQPCRSELYTGLYPMRNGCSWNHSSCLPGTQSMPQHFSKLGYRVGLAGKVHVAPKSVFPFEVVAGFDRNAVRRPTQPHDLTPARSFVTRDDQPFFLVVALTEPHVPWVMGDASAYPPADIHLPDHIADTPETRASFSRYLAEITYMDGQVGELLQMLDATGHRDDTLVMFTSEQGAQMPGCKWTNYNAGLHTALFVRWPGHVVGGRRTDAIVQYADVVPTLWSIADESQTVPASEFDGTSFRHVLDDPTLPHRQYAYAMHNNTPEGPPYPIRSITNGEYRYIRNLTPDNPYIEKHVMGVVESDPVSPDFYRSWLWTAGENDRTYELVKRYQRRPAEELYHTASDPSELNNRIDDPALTEIREELSAELDRWLVSQNDPGSVLDSRDSHRAAKSGQHRYRVK